MNAKHEDGAGDGPDQKATPKLPKPPGLVKRLRTYFFAGVLITAPISITAVLTWWLIEFVDHQVVKLIPEKYVPSEFFEFFPGIGIFIAIIGLILVGAFTANFVGRSLQRFGERLLSKVPVVRNVYKTVKQIFETVFSQQSRAFREAVLVEYPRRGIWAIAFITGRTEGEVQNITEEETINIFLPTTPNPTSGFLLFVPKKELIRLTMTVEEAIKMVISGGIVTPPDRRPQKDQVISHASAATYEEVDIIREKDRAVVLASKRGLPPGWESSGSE